MNRLTIGPRHIEIINDEGKWASFSLSKDAPLANEVADWLKQHYPGYDQLWQRIVADFIKGYGPLDENHDWVKHEELWKKEMFKRYAQFSETTPAVHGAYDWSMDITCYRRDSMNPVYFRGRGKTIGEAIQNARQECLV